MIVDKEGVVGECYLEVEHITIQLDDIYLGVIILNPVTSYCIRTKTITEGFIITTLRSKVIQTLIIVDPECYIPGLIILPTVILSGENIALESGAHCVGSVLTLLQHFRGSKYQ